MKAPKQLKDLPGFDEAVAKARSHPDLEHRVFVLAPGLGEVVLPGINRISEWRTISQIGMMILCERSLRAHLTLLPPPKPEAANDA